MDEVSKQVSERLRELRESKGLTRPELAKRTQDDDGKGGVHLNTIYLIETAGQKARGSTLEKLARGLGVDVEDLTGAPKRRPPRSEMAERIRNRYGLVPEERFTEAEISSEAVELMFEHVYTRLLLAEARGSAAPLYEPEAHRNRALELLDAVLRLEEGEERDRLEELALEMVRRSAKVLSREAAALEAVREEEATRLEKISA